jgi:membrane protein CcdC involved in cytochrome C biogenesis
MITVSNNLVYSILIALVLTLIYILLRDEDEEESTSNSPIVLGSIFFVLATISYLYLKRNVEDELTVVGTYSNDAVTNMKTGKPPF